MILSENGGVEVNGPQKKLKAVQENHGQWRLERSGESNFIFRVPRNETQLPMLHSFMVEVAADVTQSQYRLNLKA
jgi:hypothetical protein